ncbi:hypothetical protein Misp01_76130 [Microtetraspora sp. NBRC 13810]|uniref:hypothetical protein n=1 Tax=Microtetraspora sp. NBRC 13810 TaxID=3030990 RepID=UPI0024A11D1D|nr:hypothetical protein [Microtetraspora sp. NBRC 13810]GLW12485.1 hypothetical protein Misp01_76130 [Microtetraspora sp. NBRC 13810]
MTGDTHYDLDVLAELAEDLLDAATARKVREHLAICDPCGELLADLAAVREVLAATPTPAMPMGVALRIDQALAAEAGNGSRPGVAVAEAPDWDRLMAAAPWETASEPEPATPRAGDAPEPLPLAGDAPEPSADEPEKEPVRLGVVAEDGSVVPARRRAKGARRRRGWVMPLTAAAAACAVIGSAAVATSLIASGPTGPSGGGQMAQPAPAPPREALITPTYKITQTDYNYTSRDLRGSLSDYLAPAPVLKSADDDENAKLMRCVGKVAKNVGSNPFHVDQAFYLGQEATLMLFWKDQAANSVQVRVLGPECNDLRKPGLAKWE